MINQITLKKNNPYWPPNYVPLPVKNSSSASKMNNNELTRGEENRTCLCMYPIYH